MVKAYLIGFSIGALLSVVLVSWMAPQTIGWYFEPPVEIGVNCRPAADWAMGKLIMAQIFGLVAGGVIGAVVSHFFSREKPAPKTLR